MEIGAIGDLKIGLAQILEEVKKICPKGKSNPELRAQIAKAKAAFKESNAAISSDGRFPMTPQRILKDVKEVIPEDAIIFTDVGWNKNGVAQEFDITPAWHHPPLLRPGHHGLRSLRRPGRQAGCPR